MDSETSAADESDMMSVISETTVGSINSPIMFNLLSRSKELITSDAINRNPASSPLIPDQNFDLLTSDADFYKKAVGSIPSGDDDDNSQSLLSERYGSSDLRVTKCEDIASEKSSDLEYNHSSQFQRNHCPKEVMRRFDERASSLADDQIISPKVENIHDSADNNQSINSSNSREAVEDTLADVLTSVERDSVLHGDQLTPDLDSSISRVKTREIQLSPFTGFDSEIYPESMPVATFRCRNNSPLHKSTGKYCPKNTHKEVHDDNVQYATNDEDDQIELLEEDPKTTTASEKNSTMASPDLKYVGLDDETQAPVSGDQSLEFNLPINLEKTNSSCPMESYNEQNDKNEILSEDRHQHTPTKTDLLGEQGMQVSSPQFSVVSDQSTEICRLDLRVDTIDIACSQSDAIPMDIMSSGVTDGGDPDTTNHCSNNCSIETEGSNANFQTASRQDLDEEIKMQDPIDISSNRNSNVSNLQLNNSKECKDSGLTDRGDITNHCSNNFSVETFRSNANFQNVSLQETKHQDPINISPNQDINVVSNLQLDNSKEYMGLGKSWGLIDGGDPDTTNHSSIETERSNANSRKVSVQDPIVKSPNQDGTVVSKPDYSKEDQDDPTVHALDKANHTESPSSPTMSCVSESILCTTNDKEGHKGQIIQKRNYGISIPPVMDRSEMGPKHQSINEEQMLVKSEENSKEERSSPANDTKQSSAVLSSCVALPSVFKDQSEHDINHESNNHKDPNIEELTICIGGASDELAIEAKEGIEELKINYENISATGDTDNLKRLALPKEHNSLELSQLLNNSSTNSSEKCENAAGGHRMLETCLPKPLPSQELLKHELIHDASSGLSNEVSKPSDSLKTHVIPEHPRKSNPSSTISQNISAGEYVPSSDTLKQLEPTRKLKSVENIAFMYKSEQLEISKKNTELSQSTPSYKSMIYSQNIQKSKSEVQQNVCSQQNTPEAALRRSRRESKHPIRFSSPEQNIESKAAKQGSPVGNKMPTAKPNYKTGSKKQRISIRFINSKTDGKAETQDMEFSDDFEVHQEMLNTYIQMEIMYGQLQDDMKRNSPDRESLKRCSLQFKTLQPQLMKLLSDSKQESQRISSKACTASDKSLMRTRIKLLSIRQKKLKSLFDKHCRAQSTLRLMKSKLVDEDKMNFTQMNFTQKTTHQSAALASQTMERAELLLNVETGVFESGGKRVPKPVVSDVPIQSEALSAVSSRFAQSSSNRDDPHRQPNVITVVSVPRSGNSCFQTNPPKTPENLSQKIVTIPVGKASVGQNQITTSIASKKPYEERRNSKKLITHKFVPPSKPIYVRDGNADSTGVSATSRMESMTPISISDIHNKPSMSIIVPTSVISTRAPQSTFCQVTKSSNDDEILDIILKSLNKDADESTDSVSNTVPKSCGPLHQEDSDSNVFEFDNETGDLTQGEEMVSNIYQTQTKMKQHAGTINLPGIEPNQQSYVQQCSNKIVQNPLVKPSTSDINYHSLTKTPGKKSPFHSPCRSVMSLKSSFSTSSTRYLMKMKEKALKITQAKTARDFQTAIGAPDTKKYKKFPSLKRMMDRGLLKPGKNKLSIIRKGERVTATLLNSGMILDATGPGFSTATKWFSAVTGTQLTTKAKAYRMVCYENTPLMEFKKQYDKLGNVNLVTSSSQTRGNAGTTITASPQTAFQTSTNTAAMPVRYQMTLPRPSNPRYPHRIPNQVRYSIRTRCITPVSIPRNLIRVTPEFPLNRSLIGNQDKLDQRNQLIQTTSLSADQSKTADDASMIRPLDPQSLLKEEIRSMLMKSVNALLVSDSELIYYPDITEDFWVKPFKDVDISKELWKEVDAW
ncbi:hypothetical protein LOTGIDRAFT_237598 [Lottia gigantea]|uniref:RAMA domain-containing protein n=1 Tax=Lottia gigantea TaxID=225164 RepID=V4AHQ3_LOTGI|nr:hypothetical protein LOTGIDRAFT_237598 [Lottia gigantea]ESP03594.1 hypothetical protein LOTGIDRAFT_237598 [Lottia gigantea]